MGSLVAAIAFLTRIPVPSWVHTEPPYIQRAAPWFPLVGVLLGSMYAGFAWLALHSLPPTVVAVLVIALDALLTGALHLDGLADMADGFGGGKSREEVLRIMRDHCVGSYGTTALVVILLLKTVCLSEVLSNSRGLWILVVAPALSRWGILLLCRCTPYARETTGSAAGTGALSTSVTRLHLLIGTGLCLPCLLVTSPLRMVSCWVTVAACTLCLGMISRVRIGGFTGDVLGASAVVSEAAQFLIAVLLRA